MRRTTGLWLALASLALSCGLRDAHAQEENKPASEDNRPKMERRTASGLPGVPGVSGEKPMHAYRVDFLINELEDGKKINARHYSMILTSGDRNTIKIGTRVPVSPTQGSFQYIDLGTSIDCRLVESGDDVSLDVHSDFSNLAGPEEQHSSQPIIRQISIHGHPLATEGKSVIIGIVDDPNSNRQFQLEATAIRLK